MASRKKSRSTRKATSNAKSKTGRKAAPKTKSLFCASPPEPARTFTPDIGLGRQRSIINLQSKWVNGTELRYFFFQTPSRWRGTSAQERTVRDAFAAWTAVGIGIRFLEVSDPSEAEIRIGFERGDGHWSYLGRTILRFGPSEKTMNLDRSFDLDTAIHEIGHTLGLPHEHQNPNSGIEWNEEAVYAALAQPPNGWSRETTYHNILRKLSPADVFGSDWDPDSIMHYPFEPELINAPPPYNVAGIDPAPRLSERDKRWITEFYPPLRPSLPKLRPFRSVVRRLDEGEQVDFEITPDATREYRIQTFGQSDTVMVLFEDVNGDLRHRAADDDSGTELNARIEAKLYAGRRYVLRARLYWQFSKGDFAILLW